MSNASFRVGRLELTNKACLLTLQLQEKPHLDMILNTIQVWFDIDWYIANLFGTKVLLLSHCHLLLVRNPKWDEYESLINRCILASGNNVSVSFLFRSNIDNKRWALIYNQPGPPLPLTIHYVILKTRLHNLSHMCRCVSMNNLCLRMCKFI